MSFWDIVGAYVLGKLILVAIPIALIILFVVGLKTAEAISNWRWKRRRG
jgi:hypothetical protein